MLLLGRNLWSHMLILLKLVLEFDMYLKHMLLCSLYVM